MIIEEYKSHLNERGNEGLPALPLSPEQTAEIIEYLKDENNNDVNLALELLTHRVPAGVDQSAYVKAAFLNDVAIKKISSSIISPSEAVKITGHHARWL
jgi:aconitate hydratase 2/2-methylisocitrate dehydratase